MVHYLPRHHAVDVEKTHRTAVNFEKNEVENGHGVKLRGGGGIGSLVNTGGEIVNFNGDNIELERHSSSRACHRQ